jgi:hypothetical protein
MPSEKDYHNKARFTTIFNANYYKPISINCKLNRHTFYNKLSLQIVIKLPHILESFYSFSCYADAWRKPFAGLF